MCIKTHLRPFSAGQGGCMGRAFCAQGLIGPFSTQVSTYGEICLESWGSAETVLGLDQP